MKVIKTIFASAICLSAALSVLAQTTPKTTTVHKTGTGPAPVALKTTQDSLSYAIGLSVANFYKQQNITNVNTALVTRAINDVNKKGKLLLDEQQAQACIVNYMQKSQAEKATGQ
jgi:FKBP-type peptidyl-prolyl cis-trans isomerase FklB